MRERMCRIKAQFTHNVFAHNIEIKRLKDIFHPKKIFLCELKIFIFGQLCKLFETKFENILKCHYNTYFEEKHIFLSKIFFISLFFYLNIVIKNIVCDVGLNFEAGE